MPVPFIDLKRETLRDLARFQEAAERVLKSGVYSLGAEVTAFENAYADYLGVKHVVAVNGGTLALYAVLLAAGIGRGDEVIVPANSFIASAEAIVMTGATPVFCDVDSQTDLLDEHDAMSRATPRTKAIMPVHLYGRMMDLSRLTIWARERGVIIVEDACQAHGASVAGKMAGTVGDAGCFSFYPTKNLGALGEGGAIATNDDRLAERLRGIRVHGCTKEKYRHDLFGTNLKMDSLQGAFLSIKLEGLSQANGRRQEIACLYEKGLSDTPLRLPVSPSNGAHVYHLYVVKCDEREKLQQHLASKGIQTAIHYPLPIHKQTPFKAFVPASCVLPQAERLANTILSLPLFPLMTDSEVEEVIGAVREYYQV